MRKLPMILLAIGLIARPAYADDVSEARREFLDGTALVRAERWGEALAAFERAAKLKPHAVTTYNIAQCERAMGNYTRAWRAFSQALAQNELPEAVTIDAKAELAEVERLLPHIHVALEPADAELVVDGRPIAAVGDDFVAGILPPGPSTAEHPTRFELIANPGVHVFTVSRRGYQDVVVNRSFGVGTPANLDLVLDRLPATIHVTSNLADAVVRVSDVDVGNAPVEVSRHAGRYHVHVLRKGFLSYDTDVTVLAGERVDLDAELKKETPAITQRWWFWTAAAVLVVGAAATTYFVARAQEEPPRPPTDGGGLGWSLKVP